MLLNHLPTLGCENKCKSIFVLNVNQMLIFPKSNIHNTAMFPLFNVIYIMTSSNGNIFCVTGHLCAHKGQWCGDLMFSLICVWINGWVNNREAGDLRCYHAHYYVTVMFYTFHLLYILTSVIFILKHFIEWYTMSSINICDSFTHNLRTLAPEAGISGRDK